MMKQFSTGLVLQGQSVVIQFRTQRKKEGSRRTRSVCAAKGKGGHSRKGGSSGGHRKTGKKMAHATEK
jgi:hypothetical protein